MLSCKNKNRYIRMKKCGIVLGVVYFCEIITKYDL